MAAVLTTVLGALALLSTLCSSDETFNMGWKSAINHGTLQQLNEEGTLTGFFADIYANRSDIVDFQVWFVNSTPNNFIVSTIAINRKTHLQAKVIWAANANKPVGMNAILDAASGNLRLLDGESQEVWSTGTYGKGVQSLWMTNVGNLVLIGKDEQDVKWESFDTLTSTLIFQRALKPGSKLKGSISETNLTPGPYSLEVDKNEHRLVLKYNAEVYWSPSGSEEFTVPVFATLCSDQGKLYLYLGTNFSSFGPTNKVLDANCSNIIQPAAQWPFGNLSIPALPLLILQPNGDLQVVAWNTDTSAWEFIFSLFEDKPCQLPRRCGPFRFCKSETGACGECPPGFVDVDQNRLNLGCRPNTTRSTFMEPEHCSNSDTFQELKHHQYFATNFMAPTNGTPEECMKKCLENCTCQASFYRKDNDDIDNTSFCYVAEDVGTIQVVAGTEQSTHLAFLRIYAESGESPPKVTPKGQTTHNRKHVPAIVGGAGGAFVGVAMLIALVWGVRRKVTIKLGTDTSSSGVSTVDDTITLELPASSLARIFSSKELQEITNDYSCIIGAGASGLVYKGVLHNGDEVAVKKLNTHLQQKQFHAEVKTLAKTKHWNLVELVGLSSRRTLIYEYMVNGSLDSWLFNNEKRGALSWEARFNIAVGTARGLTYLHEDCAEKIIHLDLKPQNILLDSEFNAKIGDFGLSKSMERQQSCVGTLTVKGTPGYLAPEWKDGLITEKIDVYSYGVVLLELVSGRRYHELLSSGLHQADHASVVQLLVDNSLTVVDKQQVERLVRVALMCLESEAVRRPRMSIVVQMLQGLRVASLDHVMGFTNEEINEIFSGSTPAVLVSLAKALSGGSSSSTSAVFTSGSSSTSVVITHPSL